MRLSDDEVDAIREVTRYGGKSITVHTTEIRAEDGTLLAPHPAGPVCAQTSDMTLVSA